MMDQDLIVKQTSLAERAADEIVQRDAAISSLHGDVEKQEILVRQAIEEVKQRDEKISELQGQFATSPFGSHSARI